MDQGGGTLILEGQGRYLGPGGQTVYLDDGVYRLVNHYYDAFDNGIAKLQVHDLAWTGEGWPRVEQP
jgi:arabinan endo-1,5-alpha-L-arabinosidase